MKNILAIKLQPDDSLVIHPSTWQYLYTRWIDKDIGPKRQILRLEPNREEIALERFVTELWASPIVRWA